MSISSSSLKRKSSLQSSHKRNTSSLPQKKLKNPLRTPQEDNPNLRESSEDSEKKSNFANEEIYDDIHDKNTYDELKKENLIKNEFENEQLITIAKDLFQKYFSKSKQKDSEILNPNNLYNREAKAIIASMSKLSLRQIAIKAGLTEEIILKAIRINRLGGGKKQEQNIRFLSFKSMVKITLAIMLELKNIQQNVNEKLLSEMPYNEKFMDAMEIVKQSFEKEGVQFNNKYDEYIKAIGIESEKTLLDATKKPANNLPKKEKKQENVLDIDIEILNSDSLYTIQPDNINSIICQKSLSSIATKAGLGNDTITKARLLASLDKQKEEKNIRPLSVISLIKITLAIMLELKNIQQNVNEKLLSEMPYNEKFMNAMEIVKQSFEKEGVQFNNKYDEYIKAIGIESEKTLLDATKKAANNLAKKEKKQENVLDIDIEILNSDSLYTIQPDNINSIICQKSLSSIATKAGLGNDTITKARLLASLDKQKEEKNIRPLSVISLIKITLAIMLELKNIQQNVNEKLLSEMPYNEKFMNAMEIVKQSFEKEGVQFNNKYDEYIKAIGIESEKTLLDATKKPAKLDVTRKPAKLDVTRKPANNLPKKEKKQENVLDIDIEILNSDSLYTIQPDNINSIIYQKSLSSIATKAGLGNDTITKARLLASLDKQKEEKNIRPLSVISLIKITLAIMLESKKIKQNVNKKLLSEMPYNEKFMNAMEVVKQSFEEMETRFDNHYEQHIEAIESEHTLFGAIGELNKIMNTKRTKNLRKSK